MLLSRLMYLFLFPGVQALCHSTIKKVECSFPKSQCSKEFCNITYIDQYTVRLDLLGCVLKKAHQTLSIRARHEIKVSRNDYAPGRFDYTFSLCEMANGLNIPFLNMLLGSKAFESTIHACPYKVGDSIVMKNVTVASNSMPALGQNGLYRLTFYMISGKYLEVFSVVTTGQRCGKN